MPVDVSQAIMGWDSAYMVNVYNDLEIEDELTKDFEKNGIKKGERKTLYELQ